MTSPEEDHNPRDKKPVTNQDEQHRAVNHSTKPDGGYDEPVNENIQKTSAEKLEQKVEKQNNVPDAGK
jgi:hypothetical protein